MSLTGMLSQRHSQHGGLGPDGRPQPIAAAEVDERAQHCEVLA